MLVLNQRALTMGDPDVSVLLPVHNALPWLADAVCCVLAQRGVQVELLAVDDRSTDGSLQWLRACEQAVQTQQPGAPLCTDYDTCVEEALAGRLPWLAESCKHLSPEEVAARTAPGNTLRVLTVSPSGCSGQGLALNDALGVARGSFIAEHEADDLRPPDTFARLVQALEQNADWDGVTSRVALCGWEREGMQRFADWQNSVLSPDDVERSRFLEIPAMRAAGLYRREALARLGNRPYRDLWPGEGGVVVDLAVSDTTAASATASTSSAAGPLPGWWPVDSDFFGRWFSQGLRLGKLPEVLYCWRQYPSQSTRTHSRCSLARLRACKVHFLAQPRGPAAAAAVEGAAHVELWACGETATAWERDLREAGIRVRLLLWRPGEPAPPAAGEPASGCCVARLWAFGMERARRRVRGAAPGGWVEGYDWFVA